MDTQTPINQNPTILVVEDDPILQELYFDRFSASGLTIIQALDGLSLIHI